MKTLPLPVRIAAGLVATAMEQAKDLPRLVAEFPVTAVSQALQASMRVQQKVTDLAIKGDRALGALRPVEEKPSWATFDDDDDDAPPVRNGYSTVTELRPSWPEEEDLEEDGASAVFDDDLAEIDDEAADALDALDEVEDAEALQIVADVVDDEGGAALDPLPADVPPSLPEYATMTIPQLRGRLRHLNLEDLRALLDWEISHGNRAPFITMLSNRITAVSEA
jgi:hypothetical protein